MYEGPVSLPKTGQRPRVTDRFNNFTHSSLLDFVDFHDLPPWITDASSDSAYKQLCEEKSEILAIKHVNSQSNIFGLTDAELKKKVTALTIKVIVTTDRDDFIQDGKVYVSKKTLYDLKQFMEELFEVNLTEEDVRGGRHTKACAGIELLTFLLSLRLYKEIKSNDVSILENPSREDALLAFRKLQTFTPAKSSSISMLNCFYNDAVDYFTFQERIKASKKNRIAPYDVFVNKLKKLAYSLRSYINAYYQQPLKEKGSISIHADGRIDNKTLKRIITNDYCVSQFPPTAFLNLISYLKDTYQFTFDNQKGYVLDPCGGWGGRAVACFAHSDIYHYTAIEPNQSLTASYSDMYQLYVKDKESKKLFTINKKLEEVELKDLKQDNHEYDLVFTSPPYKEKEIYVTSKKDYANKANWEYFLFKLLKTSDVLRAGGFLVLNVCTQLVKDVLAGHQISLRNLANLNFLSSVASAARSMATSSNHNKGQSKSETFVIFRKEAGGNVRPSLKDHSLIHLGEPLSDDVPMLEMSHNDMEIDLDEYYENIPAANNHEKSHHREITFGQNSPFIDSREALVNKKRKIDEISDNEKSEIVEPKKKRARRDPLETNTVEGKKAKGKIVYDFNRKSKQQAYSKLALQLKMPDKDLAFVAEIVSSEPQLGEAFNMDIENASDNVQHREPLIMYFNRSLVSSSIAKFEKSEVAQKQLKR